LLNNKAKLFLRPILIIFIVSFLVSVLYTNGSLSTLEGISYDWRMSEIRSDKNTNNDIAVVLIDDASLDAMDNYAGRWPWPRFVYADLLEFLSFAEPKGVMFDITFTEKHKVDGDQSQSINQDDQELVEATSHYPFVYHAVRFILDSIADDETSNVELNKPLPEGTVELFSLQHRNTHGLPLNRNVIDLKAKNNNNFYLPFPELLDASSGIGVVEVQADNDSVYRRARLFHNYQGNYFPSLSTTALIDELKPRKITHQNNSVKIDELKIPVDKSEKVLVNYYGNYNTYSFSGLIASLHAIQNGDIENVLVDPEELRDKLIFVGGSAAGLNDLKNTPVDARLPGVFIHASLASNILDNDFLIPSDKKITYSLILIFSIITALSVLFIKRIILKNILPLSIALLFLTAAYYLFQHNYVVEMVAPMTSLLGTWVAAFTAMVLMEGREKRKFKRMMSQYLSPAVLSTVVDNHEEFAKAEVGSKENITMLFSDIRSFTNMSEKLSAEKVVEMLNHYFSSMTDAIFNQQGTIDKFIGDAIMAFWGAPIKSEDHAEKATIAALDMINRLKIVNEWLEEKGLDPIAIGVGIHTGDAILGNIGSENKLDYTIIGDNVNLASRIEGLTKQYGVAILITEETFKCLKTPIPCVPVDLVRVKGKKKPIKILQPLLLPDQVDEATLQEAFKIAEASNEVFEHYLKQEWDDALLILNMLPRDSVHNLMRNRCEEYKKSPPDIQWDGVFTMTSK